MTEAIALKQGVGGLEGLGIIMVLIAIILTQSSGEETPVGAPLDEITLTIFPQNPSSIIQPRVGAWLEAVMGVSPPLRKPSIQNSAAPGRRPSRSAHAIFQPN